MVWTPEQEAEWKRRQGEGFPISQLKESTAFWICVICAIDVVLMFVLWEVVNAIYG